eukprot:Skav210485  [mRNA]  locus=scaffold737:802000:806369:+ [translate_table: standard]
MEFSRDSSKASVIRRICSRLKTSSLRSTFEMRLSAAHLSSNCLGLYSFSIVADNSENVFTGCHRASGRTQYTSRL